LAQLPQRFQDWVIRFLASIPFDTLTACEEHRCTIGRGTLQKLIDQRRFPDAWLASNEDNLPLVPQRPQPAAAQFANLRATANKFPGGQFSRELDRGRRFPDGSDELIPPPRQRLDELRILSIVPECVADLEDMALEDFRLDEGIRPQAIEQFILCNQPSGVFDQIPQDSERFGR
jgi:hypothetical protein